MHRHGRPAHRAPGGRSTWGHVFDSHCHLTDAQFADDLDSVLARARAGGVEGMVAIASDLDDAGAAAELAMRHPDVWCTAGVHPHAAATAGDGWLDRLRSALGAPRCVAIGEAGLDYFYDNAPRATQRVVFERQLELGAELSLPVVVHSRDADEDTAAMLRATPGARGVLHCFDGGPALLDTALDAGWSVSFSGLVTFRRYSGGDLVAAVPADRLLAETDSPYLAPVPHRGHRNEPAYLAAVCDRLAALRGVEAAALRALITHNARRFYGMAD